ncbi:FecR family protein [Chryseolinea serpens]|uniref:FecR family protein n=1 Tax=Chryseolinea serpens TaxID=947013 RepID=A0A1M5UPE5_9BACT|nr:FecR domain-containing protein [Chryseolinea serpens]SHH64844.1 FecR family protein [Chryseolinea serpens]
MNEEAPQPIQEIITRFLEGHASDGDVETLYAWVQESEANRRYFHEMNNTYQASVTLARYNQPKINAAWEQLAQDIQASGRTVAHPALKRQPKSSLFLKIAASVTLLAVAGTIFFVLSKEFVTRQSTVVYNAGENNMRILLPDSSFVWLNRHSTLEYAPTFGTANREVRLKGEAFFDVRKNKKQPFIVKAENIQVLVRGTKFNVQAYTAEPAIKTTLEEGKIELYVNGMNSHFVMQPGDQITLDTEANKVSRKKVNPANFSAWKEEQLSFDSAPLRDIILQLENRYKVNIVADSTVALNERMSITIEDETLEEVLGLIQDVSTIRARRDGTNIILTNN